MKRTDRKSRCPVNFALEVVGDPWSLLVVRDIVFYGKHTFGEFLASEERIATSVLADRLGGLVKAGVLDRYRDPTDRRRAYYALTDKGLSLVPVLVELAHWGVGQDPQAMADPVWVERVRGDRASLCRQIEQAVRAGQSVFCGGGNENNQLRELPAGGSRPG